LAAADPAHADAFRANERSFVAALGPLDAAVAAIRAAHAGTQVAYTEPVPGYLLSAAGLVNATPEGFAKAIEDGTDPTPQAVAETEALIDGHRVEVLLYNSQATSPITESLKALARARGIPVVAVTETMPANATSFQSWQLAQAQMLAKALDG